MLVMLQHTAGKIVQAMPDKIVPRNLQGCQQHVAVLPLVKTVLH
jgi:hypothetical protein